MLSLSRALITRGTKGFITCKAVKTGDRTNEKEDHERQILNYKVNKYKAIGVPSRGVS
jgi:hypothetical protein